MVEEHSSRDHPGNRLESVPNLSASRVDLSPHPLTTFIGRERETSAICDWLRLPEERLITLTGPGGVGKTRLALHIADVVKESFADGVMFLDLSAIMDPDLVLSSIAQIAGVQKAEHRSLGDCLADALSPFQILLLIDNFEQVVEAAPNIGKLLAACPRLTILATSREPLGLMAERVCSVSPLDIPELVQDSLASISGSAVDLFLNRATRIDASFTPNAEDLRTITAICRQLDGLPLAIELAAARIAHLPPSILLARLERRLPLLTGGARDLPTRQRTVRATIAWSYDLLAPDEQRLFRRLAVFVGGFSLDAACAIGATSEGDDADVLNGVASLVNKNLLRLERETGDEARYAFLETIREFGLEQLAAHGEEAAARDAHAGWCSAFADSNRSWRHHQDVSRRLRALKREWPNLRAAVDWAFSCGKPDYILGLVHTLLRLFITSDLGNRHEVRTWLDTAIERYEGSDSALRADGLGTASVLAAIEGDLDHAETLAEQSCRLAREIGDRTQEALSLHRLALAAAFRGDLDRSEDLFNQVLAIRRSEGDPAEIGFVLSFLADAALWKGDIDRASLLANEASGLLNEAGADVARYRLLGTLGGIDLAKGDLETAALRYRECLSWSVSLGSSRSIADALSGLAGVALAAKRAEMAAQLLGAAIARMETDNARLMVHHVQYQRVLHATQASLKAEAFASAFELGRALEPAEAISMALALDVADKANPSKSLPAGLTVREAEVLRLLAAGHSDREIGEMLFISLRTVNVHVAHIYSKLDVRSRAEAAVAAERLELLDAHFSNRDSA